MHQEENYNSEAHSENVYPYYNVLDEDTKKYLSRTQMIANVLWGTAALLLFMAIATVLCSVLAPVAQ